MSNRPNPSRPSAGKPTAKPFPTFLVVVGVVLLVGLGLVIALAGDSGDDTGDQPSFGPVVTEGAVLPAFDAGAVDAAAGRRAPLLEGLSPDGAAMSVGAAGEPTMVVFLAHWCPHCQAELPILVDLAEAGDLDGVRLVAVLTGTNPDAPNFPPARWLEREGWTGDVLLDDEDTTAANAFGLAGYPFIVTLDADGQVVARSSGELPAAQVVAMAEAAAAS